jgi:hypothetical protein
MLPPAIFSMNGGGMLRLHLNQRPQILGREGGVNEY